ncbi:MAG: NAD(P)/FAD-dependent oxidoreductase [Candidatus Eremiobacteraeota bacterium]|nr:NAD(P)/FAD-dependent oxidoreductase [Candidatus Eremiobacteraeota bacterium]MBV8498579.1 NAD(P)/FAD-dependent oxidoreductase [Candidatus Eremiobacteraeota bacterium]
MGVVVIGAGPAGTAAALRAADLGAKTALVTRGAFGGMAANDGPIPVRTLAHAARLLREARQLPRYGIATGTIKVDYQVLLSRAREVVAEAAAHSTLRPQIDAAGVEVYEHAGAARFIDARTIGGERCPTLRAKKIVICAGGMSRTLDVPGFELTATPADAFGLTAAPKSMIVVGAGATGVQVASIFNAFGTHVELFQAGPRIIPTEDEDVSREVATAFREHGITVREDFGWIERFERSPSGVRMVFNKSGVENSVEAELAVAAVGWVADVAGLQLSRAGVVTNERGSVRVDDFLQTSAPHVFAAGDVTGRLMLVPQAVQDGFVASTNAVSDTRIPRSGSINPIGSFTDPEYAQVGLTEVTARKMHHDVLVSVGRYDETTRPIIDGRTRGFCKLIVDPPTGTILGCHVIGEQAVEITQMAAIAMTAGMTVDTLAAISLSFPTYANVLGRAALRAVRAARRTESAL